jgi:hypothetical protein
MYFGAQPLLGQADLDALVANMDYNLLVRSDHPLSESDESALASARMKQMTRRIRIAQSCSRLLREFLEGNMTTAKNFLTDVLGVVSESESEHSQSNPVTTHRYLKWDQSLSTHSEASLVWKAVTNGTAFLIEFVNTNSKEKTNAGDDEKIEAESNIYQLFRDAMASLLAVQPSTGIPEFLELPDSLRAVADIPLPLRLVFFPRWIKYISYLCSNLVVWVPLLIQVSLVRAEIDLQLLQIPLSANGADNPSEIQENSFPCLSSLLFEQTTNDAHRGRRQEASRDRLLEKLENLENSEVASTTNRQRSKYFLLFFEAFIQLLSKIFQDLSFLNYELHDGIHVVDIKSSLSWSVREATDGVEVAAGDMEKLIQAVDELERFLEVFQDMSTDGALLKKTGESNAQYLKLTLDHILNSHGVSMNRLAAIVEGRLNILVECVKKLLQMKKR